MHHYSTRSEAVKTIIKSLDLARSLSIASIIIGEPGTGKRTLVRHLFPDLPVVDGSDQTTLEEALEHGSSLIIEHFEKVPNPEALSFEGKHIIAIADYAGNRRLLDDLFAFIYTLPPLRERPEDVELYTQIYRREAQEILQIDRDVTLDEHSLDIRHNLRSLRASVYREVLLQSADETTVEQSLYHHFRHTLPDEADYHTLLGVFERPLLRAGLEHFGSQLKLAQALGINRNTLRKKIRERL
jgi:transcriptional regulator of acetoin/glycerol metabolism